MTLSSTAPAYSGFHAAIEIANTQIDEMSSVRHLHASSARKLAAGMLSEPEIEAFAAHVYTDAYSSRIAEAIMAGRLCAARFDQELLGTAGWTPANDSGAVARLIGIFVSPLYAQRGIGRRLVEAAENQARQAGFTIFTMRAPLGASGFFEHLGYTVASHGAWPLTRETSLPVAFLRKSDPATVHTLRPARTIGGA